MYINRILDNTLLVILKDVTCYHVLKNCEIYTFKVVKSKVHSSLSDGWVQE